MISLFQAIFLFTEKSLVYICMTLVFIAGTIYQLSLEVQMILSCAFSFRYCILSAVSFSFIVLLNLRTAIYQTKSLIEQKTLSLNSSATIFVFDGCNIHYAKWLNHSNVTDVAGIQNFNFPSFNQILDFATRFPNKSDQSNSFNVLFLTFFHTS